MCIWYIWYLVEHEFLSYFFLYFFRGVVFRNLFNHNFLSWCFVDLFVFFHFDYRIVCSSSIYGFWLPHWYLQTFLSMNENPKIIKKKNNTNRFLNPHIIVVCVTFLNSKRHINSIKNYTILSYAAYAWQQFY